jgi:hypothetical protein
MNITNPNITKLEPGHIFVFGSNEAGIHGAGAAKFAKEECGAIQGVGIGIQGDSYGIPTKDSNFNVLPLWKIKIYVDDFSTYASRHTGRHFDVTEVGCGLAGLKPEQIAPFFRSCMQLSNVSLPQRFLEELNR